MEFVIAERTAQDRFERLQSGFMSAAAMAAGVKDVHGRFAGQPVRLRFAGTSMAAHLALPFAHLFDTSTGPPPAPRLDICLWDECETAVRVDERPWPDGAEVDHVAEISESGRFILQRLSSSSIGLDRRIGVLAGSIAWSEQVQVYERGKPLARLLAEWYADHGVRMVHAGLVSIGGRGVLLAGKGGSGKSTTALAAARGGSAFLGEDYVGLELTREGAPVGHSVYASVFLERAAADWFPELASHRIDSRIQRETKSVVLLGSVYADRLLRSAPVHAIALCRVGPDRNGHVRPASKAQALLALGPSSLLQIHGRRKDSLDRLAQLVERVPCFWLEVGRDLHAVSGQIDEILRRAGAA